MVDFRKIFATTALVALSPVLGTAHVLGEGWQNDKACKTAFDQENAQYLGTKNAERAARLADRVSVRGDGSQCEATYTHGPRGERTQGIISWKMGEKPPTYNDLAVNRDANDHLSILDNMLGRPRVTTPRQSDLSPAT